MLQRSCPGLQVESGAGRVGGAAAGCGEMAAIWFITGTDTDVGKTVFSTVLTRRLVALGIRVRAVKPACSGGRADAERLLQAQGGKLSLDEINPWSFPEPLAPVLAARKAGTPLNRAEVLRFLRRSARACDLLVVEGAGGLLSPLGEGFDNRDLLVALRARPWIVCPDRLGAVGQSRLVLEALPPSLRRQAQVVLVDQPTPDASTTTNEALLGEWIGAERIHRFPWLTEDPLKVKVKLGKAGGIRKLELKIKNWGI